MNNQPELIGYLVFKRLSIQHANAISSPITYGFPAVTAFLGACHALSRRLAEHPKLNPFSLRGVLIACHDCQPLVYRESAYRDYSFNQTRNPIGKDGATAAIIEEGKCHLTVSLAVEVYSHDVLLDDSEHELNGLLRKQVTQWVQQQRIAGGSVQPLPDNQAAKFYPASKVDEIKRAIMPAFVLMDARDALIDITQHLQQTNPDATALDALIETCTLHHIPETVKDQVTWKTTSVKTGRGWLVPIPVGYQGISEEFEAGQLAHCRNPEYPSQYVETIYSLGQWVFPHRIDDIAKAFWQYQHDPEQALYLTVQP
ncbi:MAG: type I-F CRISPR-associated protein Csy2 [Pseudomonadota bacterium]|nr:type I-F CRISPR-associated protein Csy2 [Pseudomonadota bacterium]